MLSVRQFFYENIEPVWDVNTAAAPIKPADYDYRQFENVKVWSHAWIQPQSTENTDSDENNHNALERQHVSYEYDEYKSRLYQDLQSQSGEGSRSHDAQNNLKLQYLRLWVDMCCEACEERVSGTLSKLAGVRSVVCDYGSKQVVVHGTATPADVLKVCRRLHKKTCWWVEETHD